jgi:hypothetical protein
VDALKDFEGTHDLRIARPHVPSRTRAHVCWNWGARALRTAIRLFILGHTLSTCRSLDMRRLGSIVGLQRFCATTRLVDIDEDTRKGAAFYTPLALALCDLAVLGLANSLGWQCSSHVLLDFYNQHISDKHPDIGVGTGYSLDRCRFPSTATKIALLDLNPHCPAKSAKRLRRYNPSCCMARLFTASTAACLDLIPSRSTISCTALW